MDIRYINPFLEALVNTLQQFGVGEVKRGAVRKKERMIVDMDITSIIGLVGDIRGNIAYSLSQETAKPIVSNMMMGMPVTELDAMARSALGELANMVTGAAGTILSNSGTFVDITPPSIVFGEDIYFIISSVDTLTIDFETPYGKIEVNIGLEI